MCGFVAHISANPFNPCPILAGGEWCLSKTGIAVGRPTPAWQLSGLMMHEIGQRMLVIMQRLAPEGCRFHSMKPDFGGLHHLNP